VSSALLFSIANVIIQIDVLLQELGQGALECNTLTLLKELPPFIF